MTAINYKLNEVLTQKEMHDSKVWVHKRLKQDFTTIIVKSCLLNYLEISDKYAKRPSFLKRCLWSNGIGQV